MAATVLGAIHELFAASAELQAAGVTLWNDEAIEGTPPGSYVVLENFEAPEVLLNSAGKKFVQPTWDLAAYLTGTEDAEALGNLLTSAFDGKKLAVSGMRCLLMTQTDYRVEQSATRSPEARRIQEVRLSYRAELTRP